MLDNSNAKAEMKHKLRMSELYEEANDIDLELVKQGKAKLDAMNEIFA